jgi:chaperone required for assembly of F1-ATPase
MSNAFTIVPQGGGFAVAMQGAVMHTPGRQPLVVPTQALAEAIAAEWRANGRYSVAKMPLTSLAYTAIDRIAGQEKAIIEVLLVYLDTDTLSYRASGAEALAKRQKEQWDPILDWVRGRLDAAWEVTSGIMPADQSPKLHKAVGKYLTSLSAMQLAAASMMSSACSSLALTIAVLERHVGAEDAFRLSRLEEDYQAEQWGRDEEAEARAMRVKGDIMETGRFLELLGR